MQFTHLAKQSPTFKPANIGHASPSSASPRAISAASICPGRRRSSRCPPRACRDQAGQCRQHGNMGKVTTLPGKIKHGPFNAGNNGGNTGKVSKLPGRINNNPMRTEQPAHGQQRAASFQRWMGGGRFSRASPQAHPAVRSAAAAVWWRPFVRRRLRAALTAELQPMRIRAEHTLCPASFETGLIRRPAWRTGPRRHCRRRAR